MEYEKLLKFPQKTGLYDPSYEKDSCGVGMVANISKNGNKTNKNLWSVTIEKGITNTPNMVSTSIQFALMYSLFWSNALNENKIPNGSKINK